MTNPPCLTAMELWPPVIVGLAGLVFAIPGAAMIGFAVLAAV